jgi:hypothetical protein
MADLKEFAEQLVNLSVKEVNELANSFRSAILSQKLLVNQ